jgi:anti-sigma regulatory factor (Ser/Thr protein kinase)
MSMFVRRFLPDVAEIPPARNDLRKWLDGQGVDDERADDILIVASELITNGVIHDGGERITLRVVRRTDDVELEVTTVDRQASAPPFERQARDPAETGRGLLIVVCLSDDQTLTTHGGHRTVTCLFRLARQRQSANSA